MQAHLGCCKLFLQPLPLCIAVHHRCLQERQSSEHIAQKLVHTPVMGRSETHGALQLLKIEALISSGYLMHVAQCTSICQYHDATTNLWCSPHHIPHKILHVGSHAAWYAQDSKFAKRKQENEAPWFAVLAFIRNAMLHTAIMLMSSLQHYHYHSICNAITHQKS